MSSIELFNSLSYFYGFSSYPSYHLARWQWRLTNSQMLYVISATVEVVVLLHN